MNNTASAMKQSPPGSSGRRLCRLSKNYATGTRGFSLVELMMIMVVLSILSGVAATSLGGLSSSRQNVAATRIQSALIHAQLWAMSSSNETWVNFDVGNNRVAVFVEDPTNPGKGNRVALLDPLTRTAMSVDVGFGAAGIQGVDIGSTMEVNFDAFGVPHDADGDALTSDGIVSINGGIALRITPNTGLISID